MMARLILVTRYDELSLFGDVELLDHLPGETVFSSLSSKVTVASSLLVDGSLQVELLYNHSCKRPSRYGSVWPARSKVNDRRAPYQVSSQSSSR